MMEYRSYPCHECPWRRDVEPGQFPASRYEQLRNTCEQQGEQAGFHNPMFGCHKGTPGDQESDLACAGWLAVEGAGHLGVRLAIVRHELPAEALSPGPGWPELFGSYKEMARIQGYVQFEDEED